MHLDLPECQTGNRVQKEKEEHELRIRVQQETAQFENEGKRGRDEEHVDTRYQNPDKPDDRVTHPHDLHHFLVLRLLLPSLVSDGGGDGDGEAQIQARREHLHGVHAAKVTEAE